MYRSTASRTVLTGESCTVTYAAHMPMKQINCTHGRVKAYANKATAYEDSALLGDHAKKS